MQAMIHQAVTAIQQNDLAKFKSVVQRNDFDVSFPLVKAQDSSGKVTLLHGACDKSPLPFIEVILEKIGPSELNIQDPQGCTPLHKAYESGRAAAVDLLLRAGADPTVRDRAGREPGDMFVPGLQTERGIVSESEAIQGNILFCVSNGFYQRLSVLLQRYPEQVNMQGPGNMTPLLTCCMKGSRIQVLEMLLRAGARVVGGEGTAAAGTPAAAATALHAAAAGGHGHLLGPLLAALPSAEERGRLCAAPDGRGLTPLALACLAGSEEGVRALAAATPAAGAAAAAAAGALPGGLTPWHCAARAGAPPGVFQALADAPAHAAGLDAGDRDGMTPLMAACGAGHAAAAALLVALGADTTRRGTSGPWKDRRAGELFVPGLSLEAQSAIHALLQDCRQDAGQMESTKGGQPLEVATSINQSLEKEEAQDPAVDIERRSKALFEYCQTGDLNAVMSLLDAGADPKFASPTGLQALHVAVLHENDGIVEELLARGADPDAAENSGLSALHIAAMRGSLLCVKVLLSKGARIDLQDDDGNTALYLACFRGYTDIIDLLIEHKADKNISNKEGNLSGDVFLDSLPDGVILSVRKILGNEKVHHTKTEDSVTHQIESNGEDPKLLNIKNTPSKQKESLEEDLSLVSPAQQSHRSRLRSPVVIGSAAAVAVVAVMLIRSRGKGKKTL